MVYGMANEMVVFVVVVVLIVGVGDRVSASGRPVVGEEEGDDGGDDDSMLEVLVVGGVEVNLLGLLLGLLLLLLLLPTDVPEGAIVGVEITIGIGNDGNDDDDGMLEVGGVIVVGSCVGSSTVGVGSSTVGLRLGLIVVVSSPEEEDDPGD